LFYRALWLIRIEIKPFGNKQAEWLYDFGVVGV
jgi:hypothetical protein